MTKIDETAHELVQILQTYSRWQQPGDPAALSDDDCTLVRLLAEDRVSAGTESHHQATQLVARSHEARMLWKACIAMERDIDSAANESIEQSLTSFVDSSTPFVEASGDGRESTNAAAASIGRHANELASDTTYSAKVIDLVDRFRRKSPAATNSGFTIERLAAETLFAAAGRGKYVTEDMVMSLVFPSMDPHASPIGFLITCPVEIVKKKYVGKRFRVLFVEPESRASGQLGHRVREVGPFDSSGEIEERFDAESTLEQCVVPVWIDELQN
jgi:hypothetical protein